MSAGITLILRMPDLKFPTPLYQTKNTLRSTNLKFEGVVPD